VVARAMTAGGRAHVSAVRIRREGDRLSLWTRGSAAVVIPNLIALLESEDSEVVGLVQGRLESMRSDYEQENRKDRKRRKPSRRSKRTHSGLASLLFGDPDDADEQTATASGPEAYREWSAWWEKSALRGASSAQTSVF